MFGRCLSFFCSFHFTVCHGPPWARGLLLGLGWEKPTEERPGAKGNYGSDSGDGTFPTLLVPYLYFRALMQQEFLAFPALHNYTQRLFQVSVLGLRGSIITDKFGSCWDLNLLEHLLQAWLNICVCQQTCRLAVFLLTVVLKSVVINVLKRQL